MIEGLVPHVAGGTMRLSGAERPVEPKLEEKASGRESAPAGTVRDGEHGGGRRSETVPLLTKEAVLAVQADEAASATEPDRTSPDEAKTASAGAIPEDEVPGNGATDSRLGDDELSEDEQKQVDKLEQRDREVRAHEHAHARTGGAFAGAPSYTFQEGPDGKRYAVGGEVQIDTAAEKTPEATIRKMEVVMRAALAPADPSSQDMKVAQQARAQLSEAQAELRQQKANGQSEVPESIETVTGSASQADWAPGTVAAEDERHTANRDPGQRTDDNLTAVRAYETVIAQMLNAGVTL